MYGPPVRGREFIFYVGLVSQIDTKTFQSSATLAAGDVKVSKDGGALANLTTLPAVTPAAGKLVKVTLSATETQADNVTVIFSDAAGGEWCDLVYNVQTNSAICTGTVTTGATTTSIPTSAFHPAGAALDQVKGRIVIFDLNTATAALRGQATDITGSTNAATPTLTVTALSTAPASGDTFRVF